MDLLGVRINDHVIYFYLLFVCTVLAISLNDKSKFKIQVLVCLRLIELQILSDTYTHETTKALQQIN